MKTEKLKKRHGCLTAFLVLMIIGNAFAALVYLAGPSNLTLGSLPAWFPVLLGTLSLLNIVFAIGLIKLKKWAFWGFVISALILLPINLYIGVGFAQSLIGLVSIAILYGVLHIGRENKGWPQLD